MRLLINLEKNIVKLVLREKSKTIDEIVFLDERNLTEKLLPEIDKLLKRNKLDVSSIIKTEIISDAPDSFMSTRIARAVAKAINWAGKLKK